MKFLDSIKKHFEESVQVKRLTFNHCAPTIEQAVELMVKSFKDGKKLLLCGNGGSAADAQHIAAEFVIRLSHELDRPALPAIALTTDTSVLTAGSNDLGYELVFARQVEALGQSGDVFLGITTSGNSPNVLRAAEVARKKGMATIGFLGNDGGRGKSLFDAPIVVPSVNVQHIQEAHITIGHIIVELVETTLFASK
ncbi:D-sedoheptulose-7-phosphate isomerase [Caldithrix abyssi]